MKRLLISVFSWKPYSLKNILEIGTAIGFSALLMAEHAPDAKITTIDRNPEMIGFAKENFAQFDSRKQLHS